MTALFDPNENYLRPKQVAEQLGVSEKLVYRWAGNYERGQGQPRLRSRVLSPGVRVIPVSALHELLNSQPDGGSLATVHELRRTT